LRNLIVYESKINVNQDGTMGAFQFFGELYAARQRS